MSDLITRKPRLLKRVTIKDVALKAGVSIGAVSRVLHGRASTIRVSEPTAEIIRQAAQDLDYKRNRTPYGLRTGRTKSLVIAAPFEISLASSPYFASLIDGIITYAGEKGYTICLSKGSMAETLKFDDSKGKFDGIIWLGVPTKMDEEEREKILSSPQVGINLEAGSVPESIANVRADEVQTIINYVGHLRVNDVTKIGLLAKSGDSGGLMDESSLKDVCKRLAIEFHSYKELSEVPKLLQNTSLEVALVWELADAASLTEMMNANAKGGRKVEISAIVTDVDMMKSKIPGKHFSLPLNQMCKSAVDLLISRVENPQAASSGLALPIPIPA
jgi:DNA-binding LacI/PurR family transcriptional regulator